MQLAGVTKCGQTFDNLSLATTTGNRLSSSEVTTKRSLLDLGENLRVFEEEIFLR